MLASFKVAYWCFIATFVALCHFFRNFGKSSQDGFKTELFILIRLLLMIETCPFLLLLLISFLFIFFVCIPFPFTLPPTVFWFLLFLPTTNDESGGGGGGRQQVVGGFLWWLLDKIVGREGGGLVLLRGPSGSKVGDPNHHRKEWQR